MRLYSLKPSSVEKVPLLIIRFVLFESFMISTYYKCLLCFSFDQFLSKRCKLSPVSRHDEAFRFKKKINTKQNEDKTPLFFT